MRKSYNYEVILAWIRIQGLYGSGLRFLAGSGFDEYGSETLQFSKPLRKQFEHI